MIVIIIGVLMAEANLHTRVQICSYMYVNSQLAINFALNIVSLASLQLFVSLLPLRALTACSPGRFKFTLFQGGSSKFIDRRFLIFSENQNATVRKPLFVQQWSEKIFFEKDVDLHIS